MAAIPILIVITLTLMLTAITDPAIMVITDLIIMAIEGGSLVTGGMVGGGEPGFRGIGDIGVGIVASGCFFPSLEYAL